MNNSRYDKAGFILTSEKSFTDWGGVLEICAPLEILNRLFHHSTKVNIRMKVSVRKQAEGRNE
ncbi:ATP-binding protein (plasmid) [Pantoea sp. BJ2]|uniref:ATP-binding protein n=1 Tax=Pantoea sp. BJ2 TaxID=3141322 RepID=A0AAU7U434_9GAMM